MGNFAGGAFSKTYKLGKPETYNLEPPLRPTNLPASQEKG